MTERKHDLTEAQFRLALGREISGLLAGKRMTSQVETWLLSLTVDGVPLHLAKLRVETILVGLQTLCLGLRAESHKSQNSHNSQTRERISRG